MGNCLCRTPCLLLCMKLETNEGLVGASVLEYSVNYLTPLMVALNSPLRILIETFL